MSEMLLLGGAGHRSAGQALLSSEIARVKNFLRRRCLLLAPGLDGWLVLAYPGLSDERLELLGFERVILGASLDSLQRAFLLTLDETRTFEALSPRPLVLAKGRDADGQVLRLSIPDDHGLRDIISASGGTLPAFTHPVAGDVSHLERILRDAGYLASQLGSLATARRNQGRNEKVTVIRFPKPATVECLRQGSIELDRVRSAFAAPSQWEMGEWT